MIGRRSSVVKQSDIRALIVPATPGFLNFVWVNKERVLPLFVITGRVGEIPEAVVDSIRLILSRILSKTTDFIEFEEDVVGDPLRTNIYLDSELRELLCDETIDPLDRATSMFHSVCYGYNRDVVEPFSRDSLFALKNVTRETVAKMMNARHIPLSIVEFLPHLIHVTDCDESTSKEHSTAVFLGTRVLNEVPMYDPDPVVREFCMKLLFEYKVPLASTMALPIHDERFREVCSASDNQIVTELMRRVGQTRLSADEMVQTIAYCNANAVRAVRQGDDSVLDDLRGGRVHTLLQSPLAAMLKLPVMLREHRYYSRVGSDLHGLTDGESNYLRRIANIPYAPFVTLTTLFTAWVMMNLEQRLGVEDIVELLMRHSYPAKIGEYEYEDDYTLEQWRELFGLLDEEIPLDWARHVVEN